MTSDPIEIRRADPSHEGQILELATRTLGWEDDDRFRDLYRWKHDRNPFGTSPRWVALDEGKVVGFRVLLRWRFRRADGRTASAVRAVDTATDPDYQGRGIFRSLTTGAIEELRDEGVDFIFNTPNDQSRPGYLKMGWVELGTPPVAMAPRLRSAVRIARARVPAELWSLPCEVGRPAVDYFASAAVDGVVETGRPGHGRAWHTDESRAWLAWRYGLEQLQYRVLTSDDLGHGHAGGPGAVVFRMRRRGSAREATVCDAFVPSPATLRHLVRGVLRRTGADYAVVATNRRADLTPALALSAFSPLVTWRALAMTSQPDLDDFAFSVGDLELF